MSDFTLLRELDEQRTTCAERAGPAIVSIESRRGRLAGIAWQGDVVVTAAERLAGVDDVRVAGANGSASGNVVALDLRTDVAVLRCERVWTDTARPALSPPAVGAAVTAIGREGTDLAASWGSVLRVGGPWHSRRGGLISRRLEFDIRLPPAGEGGALVNVDGALVAMAVMGARGRVLGIPPETIERAVKDVTAHGRLRHGYLGLSVLPLPLRGESRARWGVSGRGVLVVADVVPQSPADAQGLDVGDLLVAADGENLETVEALTALVYGRSPGDTIRLRRRRGAQVDEFELKLGERPAG